MKKHLDKNFWLNFIDVNENFNNTCVIKESFSDTDKNILFDSVREVLYKRINDKILDKGFRLYFEGEKLNKDSTKEFFLQNPPKMDEDIIEYCKRIFDKKFGIIMNNNEVFSEQLASRVFEMIKPLFDLAGLPPLGNEITVFIGNYGWTPLGIHKDHVGENVIHFHLGPGRKQMYTWDDEIYEKIVDKDILNNKNIEPILNYAKKYDFGERDVFYMPWNKNHVGYTEEISIGVSLWFQSTDNYTYTKKIIEYFISEFLPKDKKILPPQIDYINNHDTFEYFKQIILTSIDKKESTLDEFLKKMYLDFKFTLLSNGNWANLPIENKIDDIDYNFFKGKTIELSKPFNIIFENYQNEKLNIFVRGHRIRLKYFNDFEELLIKLNDNKIIIINDTLKNLNIPEEPFLYILLTLYKYKGIIISSK
ncbi:hypothetical protein [Tenacibaculum dicentrarchi]|uniref:hypothetical protein n=1 Tax=Tenacibaculum dicentrarchi TaxID=669041 RepID=UPI002307965E|nr:hypothetical protein [Tenacibaculum dicentrarchi]